MKKSLMLIVLLIFVFLTACSSDETAKQVEGTKEGTAGGTLVVARQSDAESLDPQFTSSISTVSIVYHHVYENLVQYNEDREIEPMLAKSWEQLDDLIWEFKLRDDVKFHDGTPFNAEAVKKTIDRSQDPQVASPRAIMFSSIKEVEVVDEYTVRFHLKEPFAPLLSNLASHEGAIQSPKALDEMGKDIGQHPVGTGPYKFVSWTPGSEIVVEKNKNYWGEPGKPDKIVWKITPEDSTRIAMLETGEAQVAEPIPFSEVKRIESSSNMNLYRSDSMGTEWIGFNTKAKPLNDVRVRQAISYAVERSTLIDGVFNGIGKPAKSTLGEKVIGYSDDLPSYDYDIDKAKKLLKEAGYPDGFKLTISTTDLRERQNLAEVLQSQLKGIGIDLKINVMEAGTFYEAAAKGDIEMFISAWRNATGDGDYNQYNLFYSASKGATGNYFFYDNKKVDALIEEGRAVTDSKKRDEIYKELQQIELKDALYIPVRTLENVAATGENVGGVEITPAGYLQLMNVTIK
ncbi:glutathione ABC transporter substrate-binding protein [Niallia sp. NCCP-28]|uniref:glutathione ABC transporter substrate-binding protein n=1 Tax=Niallia sp. NCCP-28 TaxID=2934712 RepID=UPI00207F3281|nr:glutathione ABC transporter substrate-binding protein [Niallia sp. NCCP-28]GKU85078.1 glutathione ABC transporter substrate-binding protein [Niallia sp. NCCP-28]